MQPTEQNTETVILGVEISVDEIREKIKKLTDIPEANLKDAMVDLKKALRLNPAACNLLLPEEIGLMVQHLYKVTKTQVVVAKSKDVVKTAKKVDLSNTDLVNKALDEL